MYPSITDLLMYPSIHPDTDPTFHFCVSISSIYLSIHPSTPMYLFCFACLSIHSLIYQAAYPCIILLCIYVPIHYRSTYVSVRPSIQAQTQQSISVCLSHLSTYPSTHTNVPILLCVSVYPYLSVPPPPPMHLMISIGSVTDCSERSKLAVPSLVT